MTDHAYTAELPEGYVLRPARKIARSTRNKSWSQSQEIQWSGMLRDLYVGGGYGWQRWGSGHISSGITNALASRGCIEIAESKRGALLFRLTVEGGRIACGYMEDRGDDREPPADAPASYQPTPRPTPTLSPDDEHLLAVLRDELRAIEESLARFAEYERQDEIADYDQRDRLQRRAPELRRQIAALAGSAS